MAEARLKVIQAGPHVSFQDGGRPGLMRYGVTRSGPMDRLAHAAANRALGRPEDATAIEVSLGGLVLECTAGVLSLAVAGGGFVVSAAGLPVPAWGVLTLRTGERLTIRPGHWGSWCSLALAGDPQVPSWLGHTATHTLSGRGGGLLKPGAEIVVENARVIGSRPIPCPVFARPLRMAAVVPGPQDHHFRPGAIGALVSAPWRVSSAYDRMGMRLEGPALALEDALSIPSEAIVAGSIQVSGDGVPTLLLRDHQTTGGYPKIATVLGCELDRIVQLRPRDVLRFMAVTPAEAVARARRHAVQTRQWLDRLDSPPADNGAAGRAP